MRTPVKAVLGALVALVLLTLVGVGSWTVATSRADDAASSPAPTPSEVPVGVPTIVTADEVDTLAFSHYPLYWLGERPDTQIELTLTSNGSVFVRYLPPDAEAGDQDEYLTVATYRSLNGYESLSSVDEDEAEVERTQSGATVVVFDDQPRSTYFSFEHAAFQVEVFSPEDGESKQLTDDGDVVLAGEGPA